jgi:hypothetical protein
LSTSNYKSTLIPPPVIPETLMASTSELEDRYLRRLVTERINRENEALRLYEPLPIQQDFHKSTASERILLGSNRSGKTTSAMVELARAVTGQDPHNKYPLENGRAIVVGKDEKHLSGVFYRKLFRSAFKVIKDEITGKRRAYRPWTDSHREHEAKPGPPLIPSRFIKGGKDGIAWKDKKASVPSAVQFENGWEINFFSSLGEPPQGIDIDVCLFDEEIEHKSWYPEMAARLLDRHGRFIWSATPQNDTEMLALLSERAEIEMASSPVPSVVQFNMLLTNNPHIGMDEKIALEKKFENMPDEYNARILGKFNKSSYLIYPNFIMDRNYHSCAAWSEDEPDGILIDSTFNQYMFVDPGRTVCAVLFWAVPPKDHPRADQRFIFDELYIRNCNSEIFGDNVLAKLGGRYCVGFYIDPSSLRQDIIGGGASVLAQYAEALKNRRVISHNTGSSFAPWCNDKTAGILKAQSWMHVSPATGRPKLQVVEGRCPNFEHEIRYYRKKKLNNEYIDKPMDRHDHAMDCFYPFTLLDPQWQAPPKRKKYNAAYEGFQKIKDDEKRKGRNQGIHLGPGSIS